MPFPPEVTALERSPALSICYLYAVQAEGGETHFYSNYDRQLSVSGLPAEFEADDPQVFTRSNIKHASIKGTDRFETRSVEITADSSLQQFRRYLLTAPVVRLKAWILRVASDSLRDGTVLEYARDMVIAESGLLSQFGFQGTTVGVQLTPEPFYMDGQIPRLGYNRTCNHPLYGPGCGVDKAAFAYEAAIASVDPAEKTITLEGQRPSTIETFFNNGHLFAPSLGIRFYVAWSAFDGPDTKLKLAAWHPELAVSLEVIAQAGCPRTPAGCATFSNLPNFGGFAWVPNKTPLHGIQ